ncbi:MAG TPA: tyrosine-type recombinase/integrase [Candidatus Sulfotelmatobacter sp.]
MTRHHQTGSIYEAYGAYHLKFYQTVVTVEGKTVRKQRSHRLCEVAKGRKKAKSEAADFIASINATDLRAIVGADLTVADYFEKHYMPYCKQVVTLTGKARQKPSTIRDHQQLWNQFLKPHFGTTTLQEYEARRGNRFLESLKDSQKKTTLRHIRAAASTIFKRAVLEERIKSNPWRDVQIPADAIASDRTKYYTLEEAEDIISALVDHVDAQLILALACFLGLRPGEIAGLKWSDVDLDGGWLHIRRSVVRGVEGTPKTLESLAAVPIIDAVRVPLELWRQKSSNHDDWLIGSRNGTAVDLHNLVARVIRPHVEGNIKCVRCKKVPTASQHKYKSLYAGRRCAATLAIQRTGGNFAVAQRLLRHKSLKTTLDVYNKGLTDLALQQGMEHAYPTAKRLES